jgi:hypothetical protein
MRASTSFEVRRTARRLAETRIIHTLEQCRHETCGMPNDNQERGLR